MKFLDLKFSQLMSYGVHIGHTLRNNIIWAGWMIGALRQTVSIINVWKSIYTLKLTFTLILILLLS